MKRLGFFEGLSIGTFIAVIIWASAMTVLHGKTQDRLDSLNRIIDQIQSNTKENPTEWDVPTNRFQAFLKTNEPNALSLDLPASGVWATSNYVNLVITPRSVVDYLPITFLGDDQETFLEVTKELNLIVYGRLIGRIVDCKFIPFEP